MSNIVFTPKDFKIFELPEFEARMKAIAENIRPKLSQLGEDLCPALTKIEGYEVFPHTAKHMRRTVNPPPETWVAFCMDKRAYKKHPHLALVVGDGGVETRLVVKDEHPNRPEVGRRLISNAPLVKKALGKMGRNGDRMVKGGQGHIIDNVDDFIATAGHRLQNTKTATLSLALPVNLSGDFKKEVLGNFKKLSPVWIALSHLE